MRIGPTVKYIAGAAIILFPLGLWYFSKEAITVSDSRLTLGTVAEITVIGGDRGELEEALAAAFARIGEIERVTDRFTGGSEITHINRRKGPGPIPVSRDMLEMLLISHRVAGLTGGAFDVTVTSVFDLWGFDIGGRLPKPEEIRAHMGSVDYRRIAIDEKGSTIVLNDDRVRLDLDGIAQGYAVREVATLLKGRGIEGGIVNISGDIAAVGDKLGKPWKIGVQDPRDGQKLIAVIDAEDLAVVTSGDYERCFFVDGVKYHHIVDPHTGYPARGCASVTVVTDDAAVADALSTAIFVLGPGRGIDVARGLEGVDVLIVADDGKISYTQGLKKIMELVQ